jgi:hypothetical protein
LIIAVESARGLAQSKTLARAPGQLVNAALLVCDAKAVLKQPHSKRFARFESTRPSRSV